MSSIVEQIKKGEFDPHTMFTGDSQRLAEIKAALDTVCNGLTKEAAMKLLAAKVVSAIFDKKISNSVRDEAVEVGFHLLHFGNATMLAPREQDNLFSAIEETYIKNIGDFRDNNYNHWDKLWIFLIRLCHEKLHSKMSVANKLLRVVEHAFRNSTSIEQRLKAYDCWTELIDNCSINMNHMCSAKQIKLLMTPMKAKFSRLPIVIMKRCNTFVYLIEKLQENTTLCLREFLEFCFGPFEQKNDGEKARQGRSVSEVCIKSTKVLIKILGHSHPNDLQCLDTDDVGLLKPVIHQGNFANFSEVLINSCFECCVLLNEWNEDITNISTIFKCLWGSILGFMNKSSDDIKKRCTLQISTSLRKLEERQIDDKANVLGNLIDFFIRDKINEAMQEVLFETALNLLTYEPDETSSYDSETLQNFLEKCFDNENSSKYDKLVSNYILSISSHTTCPNASVLAAVWLKSSFIINTANIPLMVWPIRFLNKFADPNSIVTKWSKLFSDCKSDQLKLAIIQEMESFSENPLLVSGIITALCSILATETQPNIIGRLLRLAELILTFPNLAQNEINKIILIVGDYFKPNRSIYKMDNSDETVDGLCRCLEHLVTIHKAYPILNDVYKNLKDAPTKTIAKLYQGLSVLLESSILNDDNTAATSTRKLIELLESRDPSIESPSPLASSRSLRIMNMAAVAPKRIKHISSKTTTKDAKHSPIILRKPSPRVSSRFFKKRNDSILNDDKSSDYVKIDTEVKLNLDNLNEHQKEVLKKRREDIPALYSDLTQSQSQDLFSNSEKSQKIQSKKRKKEVKEDIEEKPAKVQKLDESIAQPDTETQEDSQELDTEIQENKQEPDTETQEGNQEKDISTQSIEKEDNEEIETFTKNTEKEYNEKDGVALSQNIEEPTPTLEEPKLEIDQDSTDESANTHISIEETPQEGSPAIPTNANLPFQTNTETQDVENTTIESESIKQGTDELEEENEQDTNNDKENKSIEDSYNEGDEINTLDTSKTETSSTDDKEDQSETSLSVNEVTDDSIGDINSSQKKKRKPRRSSEALLLVDAKHIEDSFNDAKKKLSNSPIIEPEQVKKRKSRKPPAIFFEVDTVSDVIESVIYKSSRLTDMKDKLMAKRALLKHKMELENHKAENCDQTIDIQNTKLFGEKNDVSLELSNNDNNGTLKMPDTEDVAKLLPDTESMQLPATKIMPLLDPQSVKQQDDNASGVLNESSVKPSELTNTESVVESGNEDSFSRASSRRAKQRISSFAESFRKKTRTYSDKPSRRKMVQKTIEQMLQDGSAETEEQKSALQDDNQNKIEPDDMTDASANLTEEINNESISTAEQPDEKTEDDVNVFVFKSGDSPKTAQKKRKKKSGVIFNRNDYTKRRKRAKKLARGLEEDGFLFHVTAEDTMPVVPLSESQDLRAVRSPQENENITIVITRSPSIKETDKKTNSEEVIEETQETALPIKRGRGRPPRAAKLSIVEETPQILTPRSNLDLVIDNVIRMFSSPETSPPPPLLPTRSPKSKAIPIKSKSNVASTPITREDEIGILEKKNIELVDHSYSLQRRRPVRRLSLTESANKAGGSKRRRTRTQSLEEVDESDISLDLNKVKIDKVEIEENAESIKNEDNDDKELPSSPVTCHTPDRTMEFLNNTSDISPIHQDEEVVRTPKTQTEKISNLRVARLLQMANSNIQIKTGGWLGTKTTSSPNTNKLRKRKNKKEENLDVLTFSREVPSPLLAPTSGILKRKFSALEESHSHASLAKRKRVNFPEPAITARKVFIKDSEEYPKENPFLYSEVDREDLLLDIKEFCTSKRQTSTEEIKDWLEQLIRSLTIPEVVDVIKEYMVKFETETINKINDALGEKCSEELVTKYFVPNVEKEQIFDVFLQKLFVILKGLSNDKVKVFIRQIVKTFDEERINGIVKEQLLEEEAEECVIKKFDCDKMKRLIGKYVLNVEGEKRNEFLVDLIRMASDELPVEKKFITSHIGILQQYVERLND